MVTDDRERHVRVAIAQLTTTPFAVAKNRERTVDLAGTAFGRGADLVVLPELAIPGYALDRAGLEDCAEPLDGPAVSAWTAVARHHGGFVAGGFAERDGDRLYNAAVLVGPDGIAIHYRKLHLFGAEKDIFVPGDRGLPVARTALGGIGMCVCYDLRFVEVARAAALRGAEILVVPTAWVPGFDRRKWDAEGYCPQARGAVLQANLDQIFIACASQAGSNGRQEFLGSSIVADPYGGTAVGPLPGDREAIAYADLDLARVRASADRGGGIAPGADRRSDVYGIRIDGQTL